MIPDLEYDLASEKAIIADIETVDQLKAELATWRKGPWIRKADHDEALVRFSNLAKRYQHSEIENGKLKAAVMNFHNSKGRYHTAIAGKALLDMVSGNEVKP